MKICIIGAGYVGLPTAACFAEYGNLVSCYDYDEEKISKLNDHIIPIYEQNLESIIKKNFLQNRLKFYCHLEEAIEQVNLIFICVGTPQLSNGDPDLSYLWDCIEKLNQYISKDVLVVIKSTIPVGTTQEIYNYFQRENILIKENKIKIDVAFCPEFLKQGNAVSDTMSPDRVIIGCEKEEVGIALKKLYDPFTKNHSRTFIMSIKDAEMTKYVANAMLATRISFMNEISHFCDTLGVDIDNVRKGIGSDPRIGPSFLYAGIGYGGSCFPKDINALLSLGIKNNIDCSLLSSVAKKNLMQKKYLVNKIYSVLGKNLTNYKFLCWGMAFKPETDDLREAPSIEIITELIESGATVYIHDPITTPKLNKYFPKEWFESQKIIIINDMYDYIDQAEALILLTEWKFFRNPDLNKLKDNLYGKYIFDGRNQLDPEAIESLGIRYYGIGRGRVFKMEKD